MFELLGYRLMSCYNVNLRCEFITDLHGTVLCRYCSSDMC